MQLIHISTAFSWRGGEQQLAYLIDGLKKKELTQFVFCFQNSEIEKYCIAQQVKTLSSKRTFAFNPLLSQHLAQQCKHFKINIIHAHDSNAHTIAVLSCVLFGNKAKIVLSRKVDFPIKKNIFSHFKYNYKSIAKIICVSTKIKEILSNTIENKNKLTTVYDGIDLTRFANDPSTQLRHEYKIPNDELIIGNVAAIASHKDYYTFVDVAEILLSKKIKAKFLIVGDGPERGLIEKYIAQKNLKESILITGFRVDIPKILPEFDILLFTSKTEGLGSSILDAYACKVVVVATEAGGIPEIVADGKTGLLAPVKNSKMLAANILKLISNPDLRSQLTQNAHQFVKHFSKELMVEETYKVYQHIGSAEV